MLGRPSSSIAVFALPLFLVLDYCWAKPGVGLPDGTPLLVVPGRPPMNRWNIPSEEEFFATRHDHASVAARKRRLADPPLSFDVTPQVFELVNPEGTTPVEGDDILIGADLSIRGFSIGTNPVDATPLTGLWARVIMLKVAMLAFANNMVIDTGSNRTLKNFSLMYVDSCQAYQGSIEKCSAPWAMRLANALFYGEEGSRAPVHAALLNSQFTTNFASVAGGANIPVVSAYASDAALSDKDVYPSFVRTNPTSAVIFNATLALLKHFGYSVVDVVVCDQAASRADARALLDVLQAKSIAAAQYLVPLGPYTGMMAGNALDVHFWGQTAVKKKIAWDNLLNAMLLFNAHSHIDLMSGDLCPKVDFLSYIELQAQMCHPGHVWMGDAMNFKLDYYESVGGLLYMYTVGAQHFLGFISPYAFAKPMDGYIFTAAESGRATLPANVAFWDLMRRVGDQQDLLGPELAGKVPLASFSERKSISWFLALTEYAVDSLFAVLLAAEAALADIGPGFTRSDLVEYVRRTDFDGITGRVKYDANGDRIVRMDIQQYNLPVGLKQQYLGMPSQLRTLGSFLEGSLVLTEPFMFYNGSTTPPPNVDLPCGGGFYYDRAMGRCYECAPGSVSGAVSASHCSLCNPGEYAATGGLSTCAACTVGYFSPVPGSTACQACEAGTFIGDIQQSECRQCADGQYSAEGASICDFCTRGTFAVGEGNVNCTECPQGFTTRDRGSVADSDCLCPENFYRSHAGGVDVCLVCPEGMSCGLGSDDMNLKYVIDGRCGGTEENCTIPMALAGYMTRVAEPLRVFKCLTTGECPGGAPGYCANLRDNTLVACAQCVPGAYVDGAACLPCGEGSGSALPIVLFAIVALILLCVLVWAVNRDLLLQQNSVLSVGILFGLTVSAVQLLGVFRSLSMEWFEPLASIFRVASLIGFNIEVLRLSCSVKTGTLTSYIFRQLITPFLAVLCAIIVLTKKRISKKKVDALTEYSNAMGTIYSALFISIASTCVLPFVCYDHPDHYSSSMLADPSILCWASEIHSSAISIAVAAFIIVLMPFVCIVVWATYKYPAFVIDANNGGRLLQCFRFLFFRFRAEAYYYAAAFMLRSLVLCLIPAVVRNNASSQVCIMAAVIIAGHTLQTWLQPWRTMGVNLADGLVTAGLLLMMFCGAASFDFSAEASTIQALGTACFVICAGSLGLGLIHFIRMRLLPRPWFQFFVCHHKRDAAAQARYIKVLLQLRGKSCFIDSDDLKDLDTLFDIVKSQVEHLVVYLTREVLTRPWCAGEIATSVKKGIKITKVHTPSFLPPTEENYANIESYLDLTSTSLTQYAIAYHSVSDAFRTLLSTAYPTITMDPDISGLARVSEVVAKLVAGKNDESTVRKEISSKVGAMVSAKMTSTQSAAVNKPFTAGMVVVSSDPGDDEASAAAGILVSKMRLSLLGFMQEGVFMLAGEEQLDDTDALRYLDESRCLIVMLSANTMRCASQLKLVVKSMEMILGQKEGNEGNEASRCKFAAIPVSIPFFQFPSPEYFERDLHKYLPITTGKETSMIHMFFKRLAIALATHAADDVIDSQVCHVVAAIPREMGVIAVMSMTARTSLDPKHRQPQESQEVANKRSSAASDKQGGPSSAALDNHAGWTDAAAVEDIMTNGFEALRV